MVNGTENGGGTQNVDSNPASRRSRLSTAGPSHCNSTMHFAMSDAGIGQRMVLILLAALLARTGRAEDPVPEPLEKAVHWSEPNVKLRVVPEYPEAATRIGLGVERCLVRVHLDTAGVPRSVEVTRCPQVLAESARTAVQKWRWYPLKIDGIVTAVVFDLSIIFRPKEPTEPLPEHDDPPPADPPRGEAPSEP